MTKKLYRSNKQKMLGGVAGGLAEYFDIDPTIVRVIFIVALLLSGTGLIAYIVLWIIVPEQPYVYNMAGTSEPISGSGTEAEAAFTQADPVAAYQESINKRKQKRTAIGGLVLIGFGVLLLADEIFPHISFEYFASIALIVIGFALLLNSSKKN